jgi:hypothetical protein
MKTRVIAATAATKIACIFILFCLEMIEHALAQPHANSNAAQISELRLKLNNDGSHYLKFNLLGQIWLRANQSNPGTTVLKKPESNTFDLGIRRLRFQFYGQLTDHSFFYIHFGQDNFNFLASRKFVPFIQDALAEYRVKKASDILIIGGGFTILSGLSRFSQPQLANILSTDLPICALPTFDITDQAARRLGVFVRGQLGKLDYRMILANPFPITTAGIANLTVGNPVSPFSNFSQVGNNPQFQGLFIWNFLEKEPHILPYTPGTYYGKRNILNFETGFITQKNATWSSNDSGKTTAYHNLNCWSMAVFYDAPLNRQKETAVNAYLGYYNTNFGPGYVRYIGPMNPADGLIASPNYYPGTQGNAIPVIGTGHTFYAQLGYLLRKDFLGDSAGKLQLYGTVQSASYDRLDRQMTTYNFGVNWLLDGNASKLSADFQNRPVYTLVTGKLTRNTIRKSQLILQYQFFF